MPISATIRTKAPSTSGGSIRRRTPSKTMRPPSSSSVTPLICGREDLGPAQAVGEAAARGTCGKAQRDERERDRDGVGEHVRRVGEQGQRVGDDAGRHLAGHEDEDQRERRAEPLRVGVRRYRVRVAGPVVVRWS